MINLIFYAKSKINLNIIYELDLEVNIYNLTLLQLSRLAT